MGRVREYVGPATYLRFDPTGFEVSHDAAGEWRWRLVHRNGNILGDSGEGDSDRSGARDGIESVKTNLPNAEVAEE